MRRLLTLLWLLLCTPALAADLAADVRARLVDAPVLRGSFEQQKTVAGFKKPLVSRGDFLVVRDQGVLWNTRSPFASSLTVTRKSLRAEQEGGAAYQLESTREPALTAVNELLLALVSGDLSVLATRFRLEGELVAKGGWKLTLIPTDASVSRLFRRVRLEGDTFVRQVELEEVRGDSTRILFDQLAQTPPPGPAELERLGK
ncbi:outer membrane lipoprotein carrier protein LolA [Archangium lipolyticum]|uniref:outer membrane lipoprotein carrier protein LolA n=1 Tax=Archangium lipolyticum TaxID=2970465 RepID=UPI00214A0C3B|nr:outer membrane lipoprotein carrier protein LolA [Archangium lipolyticum]